MGKIQNVSHVAAGWILLSIRLLILPNVSLAFVGQGRPIGFSRVQTLNSRTSVTTSYGYSPTERNRISLKLLSSVLTSPDTKLGEQSDPLVLDELCELFDIEPKGTIRLDESSSPHASDSVRGVYLNHAVQAGNIILSVPINHCLRDDEPPSWFQRDGATSEDSLYHPSDWATRLAASLLDRQQQQQQDEGMSLWLSLLPDADFLRASLPVHWSEDTLASARCTALDLAVDRSYFARAQAVADLEATYCDKININDDDDDDSPAGINIDIPVVPVDLNDWRRLCENALDIVQTRSCRVVHEQDGAQYGPPIRLLAPVFDLINHGGKVLANAEFGLEEDEQEDRLVVRAKRDLGADEQVLIDYGDSARPEWKCLASYGFVPPFQQGGSEDDDDEHVAEVYIGGVRYEVGPTTIPEDMVTSMASLMKFGGAIVPNGNNNLAGEMDMDTNEAQGVDLTPGLAIQLARRMSDLAFQLLLDVDSDESPEEDDKHDLLSPEEIVSSRLASSLRWNQHRILIACSMGLRDWAVVGI